LLNQLLGEKLAITSRKPQTTRHQILGVKTVDKIQTIYVDTPGIHKKAKRAINRIMNRAAASVIHDVDVIVFMIDARLWSEEDEIVLQKLQQSAKPVILALNKVDLLKDKKKLLPLIDKLTQKMEFAKVIPLSVIKKINVVELENLINSFLPAHSHIFPAGKITDKDDKFLTAEIVREKIMRVTNREIPYDVAVHVEQIKRQEGIVHIDVVIWVERRGQKIILLGAKGSKLKEIGRQARFDLEKLFAGKVFLNLWIKVKAGWSDDEKLLKRGGY